LDEVACERSVHGAARILWIKYKSAVRVIACSLTQLEMCTKTQLLMYCSRMHFSHAYSEAQNPVVVTRSGFQTVNSTELTSSIKRFTSGNHTPSSRSQDVLQLLYTC